MIDCRAKLPIFFKELGFKKGVEVGVFRGEFLAKFCEEGFEMVGVDPWTDDKMNTMKDAWEPSEDTYQRVAKLLPNCKLIRKTSQEAVKDFADESLDFVYIDADHTFGHVAMDLMIWGEKVRKGGAISGHDYNSSGRHLKHMGHAKDAIDAYAKSYGLTLNVIEGRDKSLSFFMIKQ